MGSFHQSADDNPTEEVLKEIEFVFFDLGNILLSFDPNQACLNVARRFGIDPETAHQAIYGGGLQHRYERGEITGHVFADHLRSEFDRSRDQMPTGELLDAVSDMFQPVDTMPLALQSVRDSGLSVGLLSNTCEAHWDWIRRRKYPATEFPFDVTILSYEVGAMKPDAKIYEVAERACGVSLGQILFLDDRPENVEGAVRRNWQAVECMGGPAAWDVLRRFNVVR